MRLFLAMMSHETNTFSNIPTDRAQFEARSLHYGGEILEAYRGTGTCLGGMIDAATRRDARYVAADFARREGVAIRGRVQTEQIWLLPLEPPG